MIYAFLTDWAALLLLAIGFIAGLLALVAALTYTAWRIVRCRVLHRHDWLVGQAEFDYEPTTDVCVDCGTITAWPGKRM